MINAIFEYRKCRSSCISSKTDKGLSCPLPEYLKFQATRKYVKLKKTV